MMVITARYISDTIGAEVSGEDGRPRRNKHECANEGTRPNTKQYCLKTCLSNGETLGVWRKWNSNESDQLGESCFKNNDFGKNRTGTELRYKYCDSLLSSLNFWGANIVVFANIIYIVPYLTVVIAYFAIPGLGARAYNKAVICYNATQIALNGILIGIGSSVLCHVSIHPTVFIYFGLIIMFLTISSTFWLFVVCIDMTSVITRFRWTSPTNTNKEEERKKFVTYATWTLGGSLLPTALACIAELSPLLGESSAARPNFHQFNDGANLSVILYVATFPALTCLANTALFCYTSYKMIEIQKSTKLATANNNKLTINTVRKRYFLFLRLYLLMDAPWITSALAAAFTELWVLKFLRMIQPFLMLLAILPPGTITRLFACYCPIRKSEGEIQAR